LSGTQFAIPLAEHFNPEIILLHVLSLLDGTRDPDLDGTTVEDSIKARRAKATKQLDDFLSAALHHLRVKRSLLEGDPALRIVEWALREQSDLIMMPMQRLRSVSPPAPWLDRS
jgi:nucleotide-binding universal stress UspA family protein